MNQLVFITLFLGLTAGVQPVRLGVNGAIERVELRLDDRLVATIARAPWTSRIDFGESLLPHRLVAVGLDGGGHQLARAEQKINVPRLPAEATLAFEPDQRVALHWTSIDGLPPKSIVLTVDGKVLALDDQRQAALPPLSKDAPHFVQATIVSATGDIVQAHAIYGGASGEESGALTAVPVSSRPFTIVAAGAPADVIAVEKPPAEVIFVRDPSETEAAMRLGRALTNDVFLSRNTSVRFLWPFATSAEGADLFPSSRTFDRSRGGVRFLLTSVSAPVASPKLRFADAVSVAGLQALAKQRRRAVVLIVGRRFQDEGELTPKQSRDFLASIGVPLFVWSLSDPPPPDAAAWGSITPIDNMAKLRDAVRALDGALDAQRIAWIRGDYLPQEVRVSAQDGYAR